MWMTSSPVTIMSRNARTRTQLLSVNYNFTPYHAHSKKCITVYGNKISLLSKPLKRDKNPKCADSIINIGLSTNCILQKTVVKLSFGLSISSIFTLAILSFRHHTNMDFQVKLNGPAYFITLMNYLPDVRQSIYTVEGLKFHIITELSLE